MKVSNATISKQDLLQLADFLYSRYEVKNHKKLLNKKVGRAIIKMDSKHVNLIK